MDVVAAENNTSKKARRSYCREIKLNAIKWFQNHGNNVLQTANKFGVARKQIRTWVKNARKIRASRMFTRKIKSGRKALFPRAEKKAIQRIR